MGTSGVLDAKAGERGEVAAVPEMSAEKQVPVWA